MLVTAQDDEVWFLSFDEIFNDGARLALLDDIINQDSLLPRQRDRPGNLGHGGATRVTLDQLRIGRSEWT